MSSAIIAPESLLRTIASLQAELSNLQSALGVEGVTLAPTKGAKAKKVKDPNAEPKEPNVWIKFTQRVGTLIKEAHPENKSPATLGKQFCSFLKEQKAYDLWADDEILTAFTSWAPPETSKMEAAGKTKKAKSDSASESGSVTDASEKKRGPKGPLSEEAKAARREKMAAKKFSAEMSSAALAFAEPENPAAGTGLAAPAPAPAPKAFKTKTVAKPSYSMEQLLDFDSFEFQGVQYGRNARGDIVNGDGEYVGNWDGKAIVKGAAPADWEAMKAAMV